MPQSELELKCRFYSRSRFVVACWVRVGLAWRGWVGLLLAGRSLGLWLELEQLLQQHL